MKIFWKFTIGLHQVIPFSTNDILKNYFFRKTRRLADEKSKTKNSEGKKISLSIMKTLLSRNRHRKNSLGCLQPCTVKPFYGDCIFKHLIHYKVTSSQNSIEGNEIISF